MEDKNNLEDRWMRQSFVSFPWPHLGSWQGCNHISSKPYSFTNATKWIHSTTSSFSSEVLMFFCCGCFSARKPSSRLQPPPLDYLHHLFILPSWQPAILHAATGSQSTCLQSTFVSPSPVSSVVCLLLTLQCSSHSSYLKEMDSCVFCERSG